jgi:hypothetical protein
MELDVRAQLEAPARRVDLLPLGGERAFELELLVATDQGLVELLRISFCETGSMVWASPWEAQRSVCAPAAPATPKLTATAAAIDRSFMARV